MQCNEREHETGAANDRRICSDVDNPCDGGFYKSFSERHSGTFVAVGRDPAHGIISDRTISVNGGCMVFRLYGFGHNLSPDNGVWSVWDLEILASSFSAVFDLHSAFLYIVVVDSVKRKALGGSIRVRAGTHDGIRSSFGEFSESMDSSVMVNKIKNF